MNDKQFNSCYMSGYSRETLGSLTGFSRRMRLWALRLAFLSLISTSLISSSRRSWLQISSSWRSWLSLKSLFSSSKFLILSFCDRISSSRRSWITLKSLICLSSRSWVSLKSLISSSRCSSISLCCSLKSLICLSSRSWMALKSLICSSRCSSIYLCCSLWLSLSCLKSLISSSRRSSSSSRRSLISFKSLISSMILSMDRSLLGWLGPTVAPVVEVDIDKRLKAKVSIASAVKLTWTKGWSQKYQFSNCSNCLNVWSKLLKIQITNDHLKINCKESN